MRAVDKNNGYECTIEPGVDLSFADLAGAELMGAELHGADLRAADLSFADLRGADLSKGSLTDGYLEGAVWNDNTVFPEGFEIPEKSGT